MFCVLKKDQTLCLYINKKRLNNTVIKKLIPITKYQQTLR